MAYARPMHGEASIASGIREWITAAATLGAVITALWLTWWANWRAGQRRPLLALTYDAETGVATEQLTYAATVLVAVGDGRYEQRVEPIGAGTAAYLRLEVSNERGHDAAEDVDVLLARIEKRSFTEDDPEAVEISFPPFAWTHVGTTRLTIPAGVTRTIDIARVHEDPPDTKMKNVLELLVTPEPGNYRNRQVPGTYELHLTISARNADAVNYVIRVGLTEEGDVGPDDPASRIRVIDAPYVVGSRPAARLGLRL